MTNYIEIEVYDVTIDLIDGVQGRYAMHAVVMNCFGLRSLGAHKFDHNFYKCGRL